MADRRARPDLTLITVTHQSRRVVVHALQAAATAARDLDLAVEIVVVDNASTDGSADAVEAALATTVIRNDENVGFGRANNQAFAVASGARWLLLNPDTEIGAPALKVLISALDRHPRVGAVAPTLWGPGLGAESAGMHPSVLSAMGHFWFLNRLPTLGDHGPIAGVQLRGNRRRPRTVDWASAAVLLLRPQAIAEVGGFDESIFMYGEDVELGRRLRAAGWEVLLVPEAGAAHQVASGRGVSTAWLDGLHRLVQRERGRVHAGAFAFVAATGLGLRAVAAQLLRDRVGKLQRARLAAAARRATALLMRDLRGGRSATDR